MKIKSKINDLENRVYLDKVSESIADLRATNDILPFARKMVSLGALLNTFERDSSISFPIIDENTQDPTYFIAAYFDTRDLAVALSVYRIVRSLTRYILLSDRYYETGNKRYALVAKRVLKSVKKPLQSKCDDHHLYSLIDYALMQFSGFWKFEQIIKNRLLSNYTFSYTEIRHFNFSKSSDASLVYAKVLDAKLPSFNENVALVLHYNQALLDILDDWEDIEDDVWNDMPNIFVMASSNEIPYSRTRKLRRDKIRKVVAIEEANTSVVPVTKLINEIHASTKSISVPTNFTFIKSLSDRYADMLKRKIISRS
jgi:hypothetical protein